MIISTSPLRAEFAVHVKTPNGGRDVAAVKENGRVWVDLLGTAEAYGGLASASLLSKNVFEIEFSSFSLAISPDTQVFATRDKGRKKWRYFTIYKKVFESAGRLMVPVEILPDLLRKRFSYHLQKNELEEDIPIQAKKSEYRTLRVRTKTEGGKIWVSLQDLGREMGVVMYNSQAQKYKLVLQDFSILEISAGDIQVLKKGEPYRILEDPVLAFSGSPYISINSVKSLFGVAAQWDEARRTVLLYTPYEPPAIDISAPSLKYTGYQTQPLSFEIEEISAYYQNPSPSFSARNDQPYESIRDFFTNETLQKDVPAFGKYSGNTILNTKGSLLGAPLEGRGSFEKVGQDAELVNGSMEWGFPKLQLTVGREYMTLSGFTNQFALLDQASLKHSNDPFGEGDANPVIRVQALGGQSFFSISMSTTLFSQNVDIRQRMGEAAIDVNWNPMGDHKFGLGLKQFLFENEIKGISSEFHDEEILRIIFGEDEVIAVDQADALALSKRALTDRHFTTYADMRYGYGKILQFTNTLGASFFRDPDTNVMVKDGAMKTRAILSHRGSQVDGSFERVAPDFRSIGNPFFYQDRTISRISPYLSLTRIWKLSGDYRKEDTKVLSSPSRTPFSTIFTSLNNSLNFSLTSVRAGFTQFDSTLFGKTRSFNLNLTRYLGRDTLDLGGVWSVQKFTNGRTLRESYTGTFNYQMLRQKWKFSFGETLTRHQYEAYRVNRWESLSSVSLQRNLLKIFLQYDFKPKFFIQDDTLYTGYLRVGRHLNSNKIFNLFFSITSLREGLTRPEVWRLGLEYVNDYF